MVEQNLQIVGVDVAVLGRASEEVVRVLDDELVERGARSHQ